MPIALFPNDSAADLESHLEEIDEHGITIIADVFSAAELRAWPAIIDRAMAVRELHPGQKPESVVNFNMCSNLVNHDPCFEELCLRPAVYSIMQRLLGANTVLSTIAALEPRPGATGEDGGEVQSLHRDGLGQGLPVKGLQGCQSLWLIDSMDPQNGATRFGIGTHRLDLPQDTPLEAWVHDEGRLVQMSLPAGCVVVYDARTLHAMSNNPSGRRRRALACFYTQAGLPRMCDQRYYLPPEIQQRVSPQARVLLGLDSPEPLSACGKFYESGDLPAAPIVSK
ncbi:MAG: phytanoyl-CoA dioxygenase family protein [Candidatus Latescibacterota bacterium]|nr:phytanoyl-CoA dioxygenase family protein [Candidatus Latescibacterota bacterium]